MSIESVGSKTPDDEPSEDELVLDSALEAALNEPALPLPPLPDDDNPFRKRIYPARPTLPEPLLNRLGERVALSKEAQAQAHQLLDEARLPEAEKECQRAWSLWPKIHGKPYGGATLPLLYILPAHLIAAGENCGGTELLLLRGEILLAQGHSQEALKCFLEVEAAFPTVINSLNVALACCRRRDRKMARRFYLTHNPLKYMASARMEDLPGTGDLRALAASILLARGGLSAASNPERALADYQAAEKLAPNNWVVARCIGSALHDLKRHNEALLYDRRMEEYGGPKASIASVEATDEAIVIGANGERIKITLHLTGGREV